MTRNFILNTINKFKTLEFYHTLKHGITYFSSFALIQILSVLTLPIFTKLLQPEDFGIYEVFNNTVRMLSVLFSLNIAAGFYRFYFDEHYNKNALIAYSLKLILFFSIIGLVIFALISKPLFQKINLPYELLIYIIIAVLINVILTFFNNFCNALQHSKTYSTWNIILNILKVGSSIYCILYIAQNYYGRILGETIGMGLISMLILLIYFRKYFFIKGFIFDKNEFYKYSLGLIPIILSGFILGYFDTIIINAMGNSNDAGLYAYAYKIAVIYSGFTSAFIVANRPSLFEMLNNNDEEGVKNQIKSLIKLVVAVASFFIFFSETGGQILALN